VWSEQIAAFGRIQPQCGSLTLRAIERSILPVTMTLSVTDVASTRRRLQEAALDLFDRMGFDAVTIDDIAEAAGTSRRTFFRHFATKEDAAVADFDARLEWVAQLLAGDRLPGQTAIDHVTEAGRAVFTHFLAESDFYLKRYRIVFANEALIDRMTATDRRYEDLIARTVREEFPGEMGELHARMFASAALALTNAVAQRWIADPHTDLEPFATQGIIELGRAASAWQGQSKVPTKVVILSNSELSADEITLRLSSDAPTNWATE
jgi:AcrR family transcriptional regulator